jgi:hypothetical protein
MRFPFDRRTHPRLQLGRFGFSDFDRPESGTCKKQLSTFMHCTVLFVTLPRGSGTSINIAEYQLSVNLSEALAENLYS